MLWHGCWLGGPHWGPCTGTVMCKEAEGEQGCMVQVVTSSFSRLDVKKSPMALFMALSSPMEVCGPVKPQVSLADAASEGMALSPESSCLGWSQQGRGRRVSPCHVPPGGRRLGQVGALRAVLADVWWWRAAGQA